MLQRAPTKPLHVLVATPGGAIGQGGIDRVMAALKGGLERLDQTDLRVNFLATRGVGHIALSPLFLSGFVLRLVIQRLAGRLDLVHINLSSYGSTFRKLQIARVCRWLGVPYVIHLHGGNYPKFWKNDNSHLDRQILGMFSGAARIVVLGEVWSAFIAGRVPGAADRIVVLPNAAAPPTRKHVGGGSQANILFLGRLSNMKGVPQLVDALHGMRDVPGWHATLAGDGDVAATRARIDELGIANRVDLPGWVDGTRVAELIATADMLVLPSFVENLPLSIIEAMASGVAVVATPVGAVEDIVEDGTTGLLVQPGDVDALGRALRRLVDDAALRARLGAAGQDLHRRKLDLSRYVEAMRGVWKTAAQLTVRQSSRSPGHTRTLTR